MVEYAYIYMTFIVVYIFFNSIKLKHLVKKRADTEVLMKKLINELEKLEEAQKASYEAYKLSIAKGVNNDASTNIQPNTR